MVLKKLTHLEIAVNQDRSQDPMSHTPRSRRDSGYRARTTLDDKGSAEQTMALPGGGVKMVKFHPIFDPGGHFRFKLLSNCKLKLVTQTVKYCNLLLSKFNRDKQFKALKGPCRFYKDLRGPILGSRGPERGPSKLKWAKNAWFSFLGVGPLAQGLFHG